MNLGQVGAALERGYPDNACSPGEDNALHGRVVLEGIIRDAPNAMIRAVVVHSTWDVKGGRGCTLRANAGHIDRSRRCERLESQVAIAEGFLSPS